MAQPIPVVITDNNGKIYAVTGTSSGAQAASPTPVVLTDANGNALNFSGGIPTSSLPDGLTNFNSAQQSQVVVSGTSYYITNSNINLPAALKTGIVVGTTLKWRVAMNKSAAGTGTFQFVIFMGTNGTIADTATVTQTIGTQTAAADSLVCDVTVVFTAVGSSTGSFYWSIVPVQVAAAATGFGVVAGSGGQFSGTVSSLNTTTASLKFGLGFIATTGTPTIVVPQVQAQAFNLV